MHRSSTQKYGLERGAFNFLILWQQSSIVQCVKCHLQLSSQGHSKYLHYCNYFRPHSLSPWLSSSFQSWSSLSSASPNLSLYLSCASLPSATFYASSPMSQDRKLMPRKATQIVCQTGEIEDTTCLLPRTVKLKNSSCEISRNCIRHFRHAFNFKTLQFVTNWSLAPFQIHILYCCSIFGYFFSSLSSV